MSNFEPFDWKTEGEIRPLPTRILVHNMEHGERRTKAGLIIGDDDGKDAERNTRSEAKHGL